MVFIFRKEYKRDFDGKSSVASKTESLSVLWNEIRRVATEFEDKQEYDILVTVSDDREKMEWVGRLELRFPKREYHKDRV